MTMQCRTWIAGFITTLAILLPAIPRLPASEVAGKHCLWQVTNAKAPFYLLGSVHSLSACDSDKSRVIEEAIKQSQQIFFEIDPKDQGVFAEKLRDAATLSNGQQIRGKLSPKTYAYLRRAIISGSSQWKQLQPWALAMLLQGSRLQGVSYTYGIDHSVAQKALRYGKATRGLETVEQHVRVFSEMNDADGETYLLHALSHSKQAPQRYHQDVAAWKTGDTNGLYKVHARDAKQAPTVWWRLLDERNARWISTIETAINSGKSTLVVVGVLHFVGPRGLLALLQQRGYKVEQL